MTERVKERPARQEKPSVLIPLLAGLGCAVVGWWLCMQAIDLIPIDSPKGWWWSAAGTVLLLPGLAYLAWSLLGRRSGLGFCS